MGQFIMVFRADMKIAVVLIVMGVAVVQQAGAEPAPQELQEAHKPIPFDWPPKCCNRCEMKECLPKIKKVFGGPLCSSLMCTLNRIPCECMCCLRDSLKMLGLDFWIKPMKPGKYL